ncbi:unnamed protein product [Moneuplotes crassus]|uniref:Uncharacterized protein n=1 Tax=Euplotes crassus TaxID=5936 RepID=A0AAD2CWN6_EUPCR|nr:unnamed protein product [Moneuplotes crassus]
MGSCHTKLGEETEVVIGKGGAWMRNGEEQRRYGREIEVQRRVVEQWRQCLSGMRHEKRTERIVSLVSNRGETRVWFKRFVQLKPDYIAAESIPALTKVIINFYSEHKNQDLKRIFECICFKNYGYLECGLGDKKARAQTSNLSSSVLNKFTKFVSPVTQMVCITSRSLISLNSDKKHFERLLFGLRTCKIIRFTKLQFKLTDFAHLSLIKGPQIEHISFHECKLTNTKFQSKAWKNFITKICHSPLQKSLIWIGLYQIPKFPLRSSTINSIGISQD